MVTIENEFIRATIEKKGAELSSLFAKQTRIEYLWNGDPQFWGRRSPVLFPIVGGLKNDLYKYEGKNYKLEKHGFARDLEFTVESLTPTSASFSLSDTPETLLKYPFSFTLEIHYSLLKDSIIIGYNVINSKNEIMLFSIGAHPAFAVPAIRKTCYEDYYLEFEREENAGIWPIAGNLIATEQQPYLNNESRIALKHELFYNDALVFKNLESTSISLLNSKTAHGLTVNFEHFPYLGIWAAKDAPFVCIEPWLGIADSINHDQELQNKEGIIKLQGNSNLSKEWSIKCF